MEENREYRNKLIVLGHLLFVKANQWKTTNGIGTVGHSYAEK